MKKILTTLAAVLLLAGTATAQSLTVADVKVTPGGQAIFGITIDAAGKSFGGFQFSMTFPATGFSLPANNTTVSDLWDGIISTSKKLSSKGKATALGYSITGDTFPDGEVVLGTVTFAADDNLPTGDYTVALSGIKLAGTDKATLPDTSFTIHVVDETTGISTVEAAAADLTAPMYNLAGQRVNGSYKGVVIQNGVKRENK